MVGTEYFQKRLVDIYDYSLMKYEYGSGNLELGGVSYEVTWEAAISVSADLILVLYVPSLPEFDSSRLKEFGTLTGQTHDKQWQIKATGVLITDISYTSEGRLGIRFTCLTRQFDVTRENATEFSTSHIEGQLLNFDFLGLEATKIPNGQVMDKFSVVVNGKKVVFRHSAYRKEILKQIRSKRIDRAILSTVSIPVHESETDDIVETYLDELCLFLSFINVNATISPVVKHWDGDNLVAIRFRNLVSTSYHTSVIIDNGHVRNGLIQVFDECYENFLKLHEKIDLAIFVRSLGSIREAKYLEQRIAILIMTYEYFLTKHLINLGQRTDDIKELNIQQKLSKLNSYMRFIPSRLLDDTLRKDIRNPLFHNGEIPFLTSEQKVELYNDYYDLLIQIVLRVLGYTGQYISPKNYQTVNLI